uniref:Secreted protein n=1 Tax=Knipowitschia caucasica TaxID=637954 RepID=A0AAV2K3C4_KNICA
MCPVGVLHHAKSPLVLSVDEGDSGVGDESISMSMSSLSLSVWLMCCTMVLKTAGAAELSPGNFELSPLWAERVPYVNLALCA